MHVEYCFCYMFNIGYAFVLNPFKGLRISSCRRSEITRLLFRTIIELPGLKTVHILIVNQYLIELLSYYSHQESLEMRRYLLNDIYWPPTEDSGNK